MPVTNVTPHQTILSEAGAMGITTTGRWETTRRTPLRLAASSLLGPWLAGANGRLPGAAHAAPAAPQETVTATAPVTGIGWSRVAGATQPSPRRDHSLTYDPDRNRAYLFGGRSRGRQIGELWEF